LLYFSLGNLTRCAQTLISGEKNTTTLLTLEQLGYASSLGTDLKSVPLAENLAVLFASVSPQSNGKGVGCLFCREKDV
jgi:hypothetical protein